MPTAEASLQATEETLPDGRTAIIIEGALEEEPQVSWTESNPDGTSTKQQYAEQLRWRVGNCGHALDVIRDKITDDSEAAEWVELKNAVAAAKKLGDPYVLVDITKELEATVYDFVSRHNFDQGDYAKVSNKF